MVTYVLKVQKFGLSVLNENSDINKLKKGKTGNQEFHSIEFC